MEFVGKIRGNGSDCNSTGSDKKYGIFFLHLLAATAKEHGITKTALVLVGDVLTHQHYQKSRLYAPDFSTEFRQAKEE